VPLVKVARVEDVPPGTGRVVREAETALALFNVAGRYYVLDNKCTHVGGPLGEGRLEGTIVTCPWHGSRFDVTTGQVVGPPARRSVTAYSAREENGQILVELP